MFPFFLKWQISTFNNSQFALQISKLYSLVNASYAKMWGDYDQSCRANQNGKLLQQIL